MLRRTTTTLTTQISKLISNPQLPSQTQANHFSTSPVSEMPEFLVILPDVEGSETLSKRLAVRAQHFSSLSNNTTIPFGGAMLRSHTPTENGTPDMSGSIITITAESKEDVLTKLREDIYAKSGVWDLERATVIPFKTAVRRPL